MPGSSETLHEAPDALSASTRDMHRALVSLQEELEAVDWYQQRAEACGDEELRAVLEHNRREEIEHAAMLLEWLRRHDPSFAKQLGEYLFSEGSMTAAEEDATDASEDAPPPHRAPRSTPAVSRSAA